MWFFRTLSHFVSFKNRNPWPQFESCHKSSSDHGATCIKLDLVESENEVHAEPPFPYDCVIPGSGYCKHVMTSTAESKRVFLITNCTLKEFRSYLADLSHLGAAKVAGCEGVVTECEVHDALKQVGLNKSPGLDGLPYEVYLGLPHMFAPILTDMFNHWFAQGAIPGSVTKDVITLLKKGGRHVWEGLDGYRLITLLNTELKILARVLANRLQLVISDLIGPEQTYAVKRRSSQDNLHLIREILEEIEESTEAALINLDESKAFDRVDHRFLATVLETAGFKLEFRKWISMMYHKPQAVVQANRRRSRVFAIERSVRQGFPLSPLLYVLALEPLLRRLKDEG